MLYLIYNLTFIQNIIKLYLNLSRTKLSTSIQNIRAAKPGFDHSNYMRCPNEISLNINKNLFNSQNNVEELFIFKNKLFLNQFNNQQIQLLFPWHLDKNNRDSCLPYTAILVKEDMKEFIIDQFNQKNICVLKNPTYKSFKNTEKIINNLLENIIYLPCLYNLNNWEIIQLSKNVKTICLVIMEQPVFIFFIIYDLFSIWTYNF